ncbi:MULTISPECIES: DUF397 domain-containing protein [unclassified Spirillospora]|uniref:DUF397 domain-containing protein n=1 Tax=unclassified Spirillospora TaxID=2642701 RepID=UPI003713213C
MTAWRKSSYSQTHGTSDCVEVADLAQLVGVRDSKAPAGPHLAITRDEMAGLITRIKSGDLDLCDR